MSKGRKGSVLERVVMVRKDGVLEANGRRAIVT